MNFDLRQARIGIREEVIRGHIPPVRSVLTKPFLSCLSFHAKL